MSQNFLRLILGVGALLAFPIANIRAQNAAAPPTTTNQTAAWIGRPAPDFSLQIESGETKALHSFRGAWVFLLFGQINCQPSEEFAGRLAYLQQALAAQPFTFIHAYGAGTFDDIRVTAPAPHHGVRALYGKRPEFYEFDSVPTWLLLDPKGVIVAAGEYLDWPQTVATLRWNLPFGGEMLEKLPPPRGDNAEDILAAGLALAGQHKEAEPILRKLYEADPRDAWVIAALAKNVAWLKGYGNAISFQKDALSKWAAPESAPGFLRLQQIWFLRTTGSLPAAGELVLTLQRDFPKSRLLQAYRLDREKAPSDLTSEDVLLLLESHGYDNGPELLVSAAYGAEAQGQNDLAVEIWPEIRLANRESRTAPVRFWQAHDNPAAAREIVQKEVGNVVSAEKNKVRIWEAMLFHLAAADWVKAQDFAVQYTTARPEFALGRLARLWIALRRSDATETQNLLQELATFPTNSATYALCREMQRAGHWDSERLSKIGSEKERNDAMLWSTLVPLAQGRRAESLLHLRSFEINTQRSNWVYTWLWSIGCWLQTTPAP